MTKWDFAFEQNTEEKVKLACASMLIQLKKWHMENLKFLQAEHIELDCSGKKPQVKVLKHIPANQLKIVPVSMEVFVTKPGVSTPVTCVDLGVLGEKEGTPKKEQRRMYIKPTTEIGLAQTNVKEGTVKKEQREEYISLFYMIPDSADWGSATLDVAYMEHDGHKVPYFTSEAPLKKGTLLSYFRPSGATRKYEFGDDAPDSKRARTKA